MNEYTHLFFFFFVICADLVLSAIPKFNRWYCYKFLWELGKITYTRDLWSLFLKGELAVFDEYIKTQSSIFRASTCYWACVQTDIFSFALHKLLYRTAFDDVPICLKQNIHEIENSMLWFFYKWLEQLINKQEEIFSLIVGLERMKNG